MTVMRRRRSIEETLEGFDGGVIFSILYPAETVYLSVMFLGFWDVEYILLHFMLH
jgi:hypothetical protein